MKESMEKYINEDRKLWITVYFLLLVLITFLRFPDIRNELKYLVISKNILEEKSFFILKYFNEIYPDKPPLYFWGLATGIKLFNSDVYPLALIIGGILPLYLQAKICSNLLKKEWNKFAAKEFFLLYITFPYVVGVSLVLRMDMLMSVCILISLSTFFQSYYERKKIKKIIFFKIYGFILLGILIKGFAALMIPVISILSFLIIEKNLKFLKKIKFLQGILVIISVILFLFLNLYFFNTNGKEYINLVFFQETIGRVVHSKAHIRPVYFYIKNILFTTLPIMPFFILGITKQFKRIKKIKTWKKIDKIAFCVFFPNFIAFSLISGKLDIYLLPLYPFIVIIAMRFIEVGWSGTKNNIYKKIEILSLIFILLCATAQPWYNENYSLKPCLKYLIGSRKVYSYKFNDSKNLVFFLNTQIKTVNKDEIKKKRKGDIFITRKKDYYDLLGEKIDKLYENKKYVIFVKIND